MLHLFKTPMKIFTCVSLLLLSKGVFSSVTITGFLYNTDNNTQVHFATPYPNDIKSSPIVPYDQLDSIIINTKNLTPHTTLFTISDDKGNSCDIGITSIHMNTRFEIIHSTSKQFCVVAPAPNYLINIMPNE
ncbi:MAG: hypothetical protein JO131_00140 [Gammaproteobacteria bacterium]|nr:hypothetical protein [Gammaproteobacteria bacterium]